MRPSKASPPGRLPSHPHGRAAEDSNTAAPGSDPQVPSSVRFFAPVATTPGSSRPPAPGSFSARYHPLDGNQASHWKAYRGLARTENDFTGSPRTGSPFGFVPIQEGWPQRFVSPCPSPYDHRKLNPSPSMMSVVTETTAETYGTTTLASTASPSTVSLTPPPLYRPTPRGRESPAIAAGAGAPPRSKTPTSAGRKSPFAKAAGVDDDEVRKTRIKTELCMHYQNNRPCPFGSNCTYAHGEEELQMTRLLDLHEAGLVDVETYRTKPCFAWVMTGSCPFGKRCYCLHDPRTEGTSPSWLPHTETQGNSTTTDINVDALHQKRSNEINCCTPLGHKFDLRRDTFVDLYKTICDMKYMRGARKSKQRVLDPLFKLQIALRLLGSSDRAFYKYRPQHIIHDELCMVLQDRAFALNDTFDVIEISMDSLNPFSSSHVRVTEIAFGPDGESTVRGVTLFFNIDDKNVAMCTPQQAKRFRWKRGVKKDEAEKPKQTSKFDLLDCFEMMRPHDALAFDLVKLVLAHRLAVVKAEHIPDMAYRFEELQKLENDKQLIQRKFEDIKRHWLAWAWPINDGREKVDKRTPVPAVESEYRFAEAGTELGSATKCIWGTFVETNFDDDHIPPYTIASSVNPSGRRLPIFQKLAAGLPVDLDRTVPLISKSPPSIIPRRRPEDEFERQKEHCWKALLLTKLDDGQINEWDQVREHFDKSRSKKVLTIIQQKSPSPVMGHCQTY